MKLVRFGAKGAEKPGILDASGTIRDLSGVASDFIDAGVTVEALDKIRAIDVASLPAAPAGSRIGPCIGRVNNFIAVGLNYADHAAETGAPIPKEPILFNKAPSTLAGPYDDVVIPPGSEKTDWEVELAIIIGKKPIRSRKPMRLPTSRALPSATTSPSAPGRPKAPASGSRASRPRASARSALARDAG